VNHVNLLRTALYLVRPVKIRGGSFVKTVDQNFLPPLFFAWQSKLLTELCFCLSLGREGNEPEGGGICAQKWGELTPNFDSRFGGG